MRRKLLWRPQHLITLAGGPWLFFPRFKHCDDVSVSLPLLGPEFFLDRLLRKPQKIGLESQTNRCPADVSGVGPPSGVGPRRSPLLPRAGPVDTQAFACLHYRSSIAIRLPIAADRCSFSVAGKRNPQCSVQLSLSSAQSGP